MLEYAGLFQVNPEIFTQMILQFWNKPATPRMIKHIYL
jgi:hypothetical protein